MCLEEMLKTEILLGALFYGKTRRRLEVTFDEELRQKTTEAAEQLHAMVESGITPPPEYAKKCDTCSFLTLCMPKAIEKKRTVSAWLNRMVRKDIAE